MLAAAPAGRVGPGVISYHHPSLLQVPKTLLQVATETLSHRTTFKEMSENDKKRNCRSGNGAYEKNSNRKPVTEAAVILGKKASGG